MAVDCQCICDLEMGPLIHLLNKYSWCSSRAISRGICLSQPGLHQQSSKITCS